MNYYSDSNMGLPPNDHNGSAAQNAGAPPEWLVELIESERLHLHTKQSLTKINLRLDNWSLNTKVTESL